MRPIYPFDRSRDLRVLWCRMADTGSMTDERVTYTAFWVGPDYGGIPRSSAAMMMADDVKAKRESAELAAQAEDARENLAMRCRLEGRDTSFAGCLARADRGMRATDYRDEREAQRARLTGGYFGDAAVQRSRRVLSDADLHAMALRMEVRQYDRMAAAERAETDRLLAEAKSRHPASASWPLWSRS